MDGLWWCMVYGCVVEYIAVWCGVVWYGVVWGGMVWFGVVCVVCVVWCGMENRGLPESDPDESSRTSVWGDRRQIAVRV